MALVSRLQLRTRAISRADYENSGFPKIPEMDEWVQDGYAEFYDLLIAATEDHYTVGPITHQASAGDVTIPITVMPEFYRLKGIDIGEGAEQFVPVPSFNFRDRNKDRLAPLNDLWRDRGRSSCTRYSYRLMGNAIRLTPKLEEDNTFRLWYIPAAPPLTTDASTFDDHNGWAAYVVAFAARNLLTKAQEPVAHLEADMARIARRISTIGGRRDEGEISTITAVE